LLPVKPEAERSISLSVSPVSFYQSPESFHKIGMKMLPVNWIPDLQIGVRFEGMNFGCVGDTVFSAIIDNNRMVQG
jgi:hypothetical protein